MVLPGSAVPFTVSVRSCVTLSVALAPVSSLTLITDGAVGSVRSRPTLYWVLLVESLPAMSVAMALNLCVPSASTGVLIVHLPAESVRPTAITTPLSYSVTLLNGSAVPLMSRALSLVRKSPCTPRSSLKPVITGAAGATVSTVTLSTSELTRTLALLTATAVNG